MLCNVADVPGPLQLHPPGRPPRGPDRGRRLDRRRLARAREAPALADRRARRPGARRARRGAARAAARGRRSASRPTRSGATTSRSSSRSGSRDGLARRRGPGRPGPDHGARARPRPDAARRSSTTCSSRRSSSPRRPDDALLIPREGIGQAALNELLVELGRRGLEVVRLKGGDPFVFGRGGEEALALAEAEIPFEVVPGVSALSAVPASAGSRSRIAASRRR